MTKVTIEKLNHQGQGIASLNGKKVFVRNALPEEEIEIKVLKENKRFIEANVSKIIKESKVRQKPKCKYYSECGGCNLMHLKYEEQLKFKKEKVKNILEKYAGLIVYPDIVSSINQFNYRNKITLHCKNGKIGFYKPDTNEIVEIKECLIANTDINNQIDKLSINKDEIVIRENSKKEIISSQSKEKSFIEEYNGLKYQVDLNSFCQVNHYICEQLIKYVISQINSSNIALDLYSGIGTFTLPLASIFKKVIAIEMNKHSHENALINQKLNNIDNIKLILGKVEDEIFKIKDNVDTIVMDPSRNGINDKVIKYILNTIPKNIIYISCEPISLARDLKKLKEKYEIEEIKLFDMFPETHHVECVCVLNRR